MKQKVAATYPNAKRRAIPVWAGVLLRFAFEMQPGELVIYSDNPDSTLNFGSIESDLYVDEAAPVYRNRRKVKWLKTGVPRAQFSKGARYEVGSAVTLFRVKNHAQEFEDFINSTGRVPTASDSEGPAIGSRSRTRRQVRKTSLTLSALKSTRATSSSRRC